MNEVSEPIVNNIPESDNILRDIRSTLKKYPSGYPTNKEFNVEIQEISFDDMVQLLYLVAEESNTEIGNIQQCTYTNTDDSVSIVFKILDINIDIVFHLTYNVIEKLPDLLYEYLNKGTLYNELKSCINKPSLLLQIKAGKKVLTYYGAKDIQKDPDFEDFIEYIKEHSPYHIDNHHSWLYSESDVRPNISSIAFSLKKTIKYNNSKEIIVNFPGKDREYIKGLTEDLKGMCVTESEDIPDLVDDFEDDRPIHTGFLPNDEEKVPLNLKEGPGSNKFPLDLIPYSAKVGMSVGLLNGALKYGKSNYNTVDTKYSTYIAAAMRHLEAFNAGEDADPIDKIHHIDAALASLAILSDIRHRDIGVDDRTYKGNAAVINKEYEGVCAELREMHKDKDPKWYDKRDEV